MRDTPTGLGWCWPNRGVRAERHEAELSRASGLLEQLPLWGRLLTGDALYCQRGLCEQIVLAGGDYLVMVKRNQGSLFEDIELLFKSPPVEESFGLAEDRGRHGDRQEERRLWASGALKGYLNWPGVEQVCKVERRSSRKGKLTGEVRYAITSLGERADPVSLLKATRGHWGIENRLHYVRDVTFGEDKSQVRKGSAPEVMAALRNVVIALLRKQGWDNIAAGLRHNAWQPPAALKLLGLTP